MKRTTLALGDDLLRELKRRAAERGLSVQALANDLLRKAMTATSDASEFELRLPPAWAAELQPGVDIADRDTLFDLMDGR